MLYFWVFLSQRISSMLNTYAKCYTLIFLSQRISSMFKAYAECFFLFFGRCGYLQSSKHPHNAILWGFFCPREYLTSTKHAQHPLHFLGFSVCYSLLTLQPIQLFYISVFFFSFANFHVQHLMKMVIFTLFVI